MDFFAYDRRDLALDHIEQGLAFIERLKADPPAAVAGYPVREVGLLDGVKLHFEDESWLLFRASGTEPLVRVYSEATTVEKMSALLAFGEQLVHESL